MSLNAWDAVYNVLGQKYVRDCRKDGMDGIVLIIERYLPERKIKFIRN